MGPDVFNRGRIANTARPEVADTSRPSREGASGTPGVTQQAASVIGNQAPKHNQDGCGLNRQTSAGLEKKLPGQCSAGRGFFERLAEPVHGCGGTTAKSHTKDNQRPRKALAATVGWDV